MYCLYNTLYLSCYADWLLSGFGVIRVDHAFGWAALAMIVVAYGAIEVGIGLLVRKFVKHPWWRISEEYDRTDPPKS